MAAIRFHAGPLVVKKKAPKKPPRVVRPRKTAIARTSVAVARKPSRRKPASSVEVSRLESLRAEVARLSRSGSPARWNADPDDVQRSVVKLVLTLVEFIRQLLERQAIRRMEAKSISPEETEAIGLALMRLEETVRDLGAQFDLTPADLNLDLGPIGRLM